MDDRWTPGEDDDAFPRRDQESDGGAAPPPPPAGTREEAESAQPRNPYVLPTAPSERNEQGPPGVPSGAERPYPSGPGAPGRGSDGGIDWKAPPRPSGDSAGSDAPGAGPVGPSAGSPTPPEASPFSESREARPDGAPSPVETGPLPQTHGGESAPSRSGWDAPRDANDPATPSPSASSPPSAPQAPFSPPPGASSGADHPEPPTDAPGAAESPQAYDPSRGRDVLGGGFSEEARPPFADGPGRHGAPGESPADRTIPTGAQTGPFPSVGPDTGAEEGLPTGRQDSAWTGGGDLTGAPFEPSGQPAQEADTSLSRFAPPTDPEPGAAGVDDRAPWATSAFPPQEYGAPAPDASPDSTMPSSDPAGPAGDTFGWQSAPRPADGAPEPSATIAQGYPPPVPEGGQPHDAHGAYGDGQYGDRDQGASTPPGGFGAAPDGRSYLDETSNPAFPNAERSPFPESDEIPDDPYGAQSAPYGGTPAGGDTGPGTQTFAVPPGVPSDVSSGPTPSGPSDPDGPGEGTGGFPPPPAPPGRSGAPGGPDGPGAPGGPYGPFDEDPEPKKRSRKGLFIGIGAAVLAVVLIGGVTAWFVWGRPAGPEGTADAYAAAWGERDYAAMAAQATGGDAEKLLTGLDENLGVEKASIEVGEISEGDGSATAPFTATLSLSSAGDWTYEGELPLVRQDGEWKVDFAPDVVHPELSDGTTLIRTNVLGERGRILASDGSRLDTEDASGSIKMLTGSVGAATAEDVERLGAGYKEGDPVGQGGIQQQYEERLAGEMSTSIRVAPVGEEEAAAEDPDAPVVATLEGEPGKDVTTAIDPALQDAAAAAVTTEGKPTSLVAVRTTTGEVLAVANNAAGFNRALDGQYAPGSSLKIITYESLLENGMTTSDPMNCPKEALGFKNAGDAAYGAQTMSEAFATSCNTALVQAVVQRLSGEQLAATAEEFGMNAELNVGIPARKPSFPQPDGNGLLAAQSIGQGQVISTPLHMATVPAAIADGSWRSPALVTDPALEGKPEPEPIAHAEQIRPMMRAVVTEGTAKSSGFEGEVYAKTGSAEFGTASGEDDELETHAWVVGYKGDIAFAAVVEGGGGGGSVAGPVAAEFANTF
ncbi:penicillin-binding transpeptidase domain-containing protein [Nocardiopsis halophila]|uniref:penicillin-binding transpeptidase domain-containing protein n=1 Tax=Nocardiopsis halophila TaxID=141692 RepID=UPI001F4C9DC8|nr:penicillin-binding transpeptidase domain-containing protein [Nocardiopsis halophila]